MVALSSKGVRFLLAIAFSTLFFFTLVQSQNFVPNELLVKFRSDAPDSAVKQVLLKEDLSAVVSAGLSQSVKKISPLSNRRKSSPATVNSSISRAPGPLLDASQVARVMFRDAQTSDKALSELQQNPYG